MARRPNNLSHGVFVLKTKKKNGEPQPGLFGLGLPKEEVTRFMRLYRKFQESLKWVIEHPDQVDDATRERFFSKVVDPMDSFWEKMSLDTRQTLIRRKAV